jgi:hypothetical protein
MQSLSDHESQQLLGGFIGTRNRTGRSLDNHNFWQLWRSTTFAFQTIFTNVNQINIAVNLALNGGTILNSQANNLSINSMI